MSRFLDVRYLASMSDTYKVERSTTIKAIPEEIYGHVIDLHKMEHWSPWVGMDPDMAKSYTGAESGVGSRYAWSGNRKVGEGSMEITDARENERVDMDLEFLKPFKASNKVWMTLEPRDEGTHVTWAISGEKTLMTRIMGIFKSMDSMLGPDFETGLAKLKALVEE